jgi:hypothetical protein
VVGVLKNLLETVEKDRKDMAPGTMVEIRFEDLEASPVDVLKGVYQELGLAFSGEFETRINAFMMQNAAFKKNIFSLNNAEKSIIARELEFQIRSFRYDPDN